MTAYLDDRAVAHCLFKDDTPFWQNVTGSASLSRLQEKATCLPLHGFGPDNGRLSKEVGGVEFKAGKVRGERLQPTKKLHLCTWNDWRRRIQYDKTFGYRLGRCSSVRGMWIEVFELNAALKKILTPTCLSFGAACLV